MSDLLKQLRIANVTRSKEWANGADIPISFHFIELAGEAGEVCNAGKKMMRHELGMAGGVSDIDNLTEELADVMICVDLIAMRYDIDLEKAIRAKFNKTSEKNGLSVKL